MKPKNIFLIRHGESEGNANKAIYAEKPDYALYLSPRGVLQAIDCAYTLEELLNREIFGIYYSPYFRAHETMDIVLKNIGNKPVFTKEEVRLREQEWSGKLRSVASMEGIEDERDSFGHFYYRLNGGESCADVYDRVSDFLNSLYRDFQKTNYPENILIFNHGMTMRVFLMRFFHITVEEFEGYANPKNCEIWQLSLQSTGKYKLITNIRKYEQRRHQYQYNFNS